MVWLLIFAWLFCVSILELQGQLADYNLVVDKVNTETEKGEVDAECKELKEQNDQATIELEQLLSQRQQKEAQIRQLEKEIEQVFHSLCLVFQNG